MVKRCEAFAKLFETIGQLPGCAPFGDMCVPTLNFIKRNFQTHVGLDKPGNLFETGAEFAGRVSGRAVWNLRLDRTQPRHGIKEISAAATKKRIGGFGVKFL